MVCSIPISEENNTCRNEYVLLLNPSADESPGSTEAQLGGSHFASSWYPMVHDAYWIDQ